MFAKRSINSDNFAKSLLQAHWFRHNAVFVPRGRISWDCFFTSSKRSSHSSTSLMRWCLKSCLHTFKQKWHEPPTKSESRSAPHTLQPLILSTFPPKPVGRPLGGVSNSSTSSFTGVLSGCLLPAVFVVDLDRTLAFDGIGGFDEASLTHKVFEDQGTKQEKRKYMFNHQKRLRYHPCRTFSWQTGMKTGNWVSLSPKEVIIQLVTDLIYHGRWTKSGTTWYERRPFLWHKKIVAVIRNGAGFWPSTEWTYMC